MNVFELFATISLDAKNFNQGLKSAGAGVKKAGQAIKGGLKTAAKVGTVATAAVGATAAIAGKKMLNMANDTAAAGDAIDKNSQKLGLSRKAYQEWDYVLSQSGVDIGSMTAGLKTMTNQVSKASKGSKDATANFQKLGISTNDLKTLSREELFEKSIKGLQNMKEGTERAALANTLFGRSGAQLQPLLNSSSKSVDELKKKANELGFVMSDKAVNAARDYTDSMDTLKRTFSGVKNRIMGELLPSFKGIMDGLSGLLSGQKGASETFEKGATSLVSSLTKAFPKLLSVVVSLIKSIGKVAPQIISVLISGITQNLPTLAKTAVGIVSSLVTSLIKAVPQIVAVIPVLITEFGNLIKSIFSPGENGKTLIGQLVESILESIPIILESIISVFPTIIDSLSKGIIDLLNVLTSGDKIAKFVTLLVNFVVTVLNSLAKNLPTILVKLAEAIPIVIKQLISALFSNLPKLILGIVNLVLKLVDKLPDILISLIDAIPDIIEMVITGLLDALPKLITGVVKLVVGLVKALPKIFMKLIVKIPELIVKIANIISKSAPKFAKVGGDLIRGLWKGIQDLGGWIFSKIKGFMGGIVGGVKKFFGIKSPSKLFRDQIGKNLALGIGLGFVDEMKNVSKQMQAVIPTDFDLYEPDYEIVTTNTDGAMARTNQNFNLTINNPTVRDDEDINKLTKQINENLGEMFRMRSAVYG